MGDKVDEGETGDKPENTPILLIMPNIPVLGVIDRHDLGAIGRRAFDVEVFAGGEGADGPGSLRGLFEHPLWEGGREGGVVSWSCWERWREEGGWVEGGREGWRLGNMEGRIIDEPSGCLRHGS